MNLEAELKYSHKFEVPRDMPHLYPIICWKYEIKFKRRVWPRDMFENQ